MPQTGSLTFLHIAQGVWAIIQCLGLLAAAAYFFKRYRDGYFISNLSIGVTATRYINDEADYLAIHMSVEKGDRNSLSMLSAQYRVSPEKAAPISGFFVGTERADIHPSMHKRLKTTNAVTFDSVRDGFPHLNLTPGEKAHWSAFCKVPKGSVCLVEVALLGSRPEKDDEAQWRSSCVSFPGDVKVASVNPLDGDVYNTRVSV